MEAVKILEVQPRGTPRRMGRGTFRRWRRELGRPSPAGVLIMIHILHGHGLRLFCARRADIECFGRDLEAAGRARATVTRRLCTIAGYYQYAVEEELLYAVEEELLEHSPAVHVAPSPAGLRVARHWTGPQRGRRAPGRRRARRSGRARPDLSAGPQRAAGIRGDRRGHRGAGHRTGAPDPGDHPQGPARRR